MSLVTHHCTCRESTEAGRPACRLHPSSGDCTWPVGWEGRPCGQWIQGGAWGMEQHKRVIHGLGVELHPGQ